MKKYPLRGEWRLKDLEDNNFENFNWSLFFPLQDRIAGEHEGFAFLGITGCIFLVCRPVD